MELIVSENICKTVMMPYLTLQSISHFGQTCKVYKEIFEPGKIQHYALGLARDDYCCCTQALARFALHENLKMFKYSWLYDAEIRNKNIKNLEKKLSFDFYDGMAAYRKHYGGLQEIDTRIAEQLGIAIMGKDSNVINILLQSKKHTMFESFEDKDIKLAFQKMCEVYDGCIGDLLTLLSVGSGEHKNKAVQYICKYTDMSILSELLQKNYLKVDEEYGHKCTLLHFAALRGLRNSTVMLREQGATLHVVNAWGKEPLDYAHRFYEEHKKQFVQEGHQAFEWTLLSWCQETCGEKHKCESKQYASKK